MAVYEFTDYKKFFNDWVSAQPKDGFGEYRKLAQALGLSTTMISQIFKGDKHFSLEMASDFCDYLKFDENEAEYFLLLVEFQKAGTHRLKERLKKQITQRQERAKKLENRVKQQTEMSDAAKNLYYSHWMYAGIHIASDLNGVNDAAEIAQILNIPKNQVQKVLDFLIENNLVVKKGDKLHLGTARTYIGQSNILLSKHLSNWRLRSIQQLDLQNTNNFHYTAPSCLSKELADQIRQELPTFVQSIVGRIIPTESQVVRCLNIDWFEF